MKSSTSEKYLEQKNEELHQNLRLLVRFINTHRFENASGYKQWYKENEIEPPSNPPQIKQRLYDFLKVFSLKTLDFSHIPFSSYQFKSISDHKITGEDLNSSYEIWFESDYYQLFKNEIYNRFSAYVMQLVEDPLNSWPDSWESTKRWFEYSISELIQLPSLTVELLHLSDFFPKVEEHEDKSGFDVTPYTDHQDEYFGIRISNLLPELCKGFYSAILLQQKQSQNKAEERHAVLQICEANSTPKSINSSKKCDQILSFHQKSFSGNTGFYCSNSCRGRKYSQNKKHQQNLAKDRITQKYK